MASIIAFIFSTRLEALISMSDEKELRLYGTTTQGIICYKRKKRHVWLVQAEYYFDGRKYQTRSKIDCANRLAENDKVTVIYSSQNLYLSSIKELADQPIELIEQRNDNLDSLAAAL